jgi:DNA-binding SARP family transcriptional activator/tetratricopeptide (TPR) repeat protein
MAGEHDGASNPFVSLLGPVDVLVDGSPAGISQPGLRILLAMLALSANKVVPVGALIDALWQEDASRQREKNLHVQVHLLRRRLAELEPGRGTSRVVTAPPGYMLCLSDGELDAQVFATLARQGRLLSQDGKAVAAADQFGRALRLWRGPALGDVADAGPRLAADAAGLEEQRLAVVEDHADAELAAGHHADVACQLPGLIAQSPLRERLRGQFMLALYRCGRQADALAAYQQAREVLSEELGLDPGPQLRALQQQILAADPRLDLPPAPAKAGSGLTPAGLPGPAADDWPAEAQPPGEPDIAASDPGSTPAAPVMPRQLPADVRHFAGRDTELLELDGLLNEAAATAAAKVIVITGTAGVGKTALALHWAHGAASRFPDGQLHINLRGYHPSGVPVAPEEAIRVLLNGLGVPRAHIPDTPQAQAGLYRSLLADRRMLIVLDNARDPEQVRPLLPGGSNSLALVTSRSSLSGLIADAGAYPVPLGLLAERDAAALLAARLGPARTASEPAAVRQIIRLCARLPLALAITAARAAAQPALPLSALADELADEQDRLDALDTGEQATSARPVFSWSYRQLTQPAARMFRLLGSHPGPDISLAAAGSLSGVPRPLARRILNELAAASLLTEHSAGRYVLHDLLHAYAAELPPDPDGADERGPARERVLDHYLHTAHAGALLLAPLGHPIVLDPPRSGVTAEQLGSHEGALTWFRTELQVLLAGVKLAAAAGLDKQAWQLPWTLRSFLDGQGLWQDWDTVNRIALAAAERLEDHNGLGWTHHRMAQVCSLSGAIDEGVAHNTLALTHFEQADNLGGQGSAHLGLCISLGRQGEHQTALHHGQQALTLFRTAADRIGEAYMLHLVGLELARLGSAEQGRDHCTQAVELYGELGDPGGLADAWHSLGTVHQQLSENDEAVACFQQALMLCAELGDLWGQAYCLIHVGDTHDAAGDLQAARETWQQALEMLGDLQHPDADRVRARLHETAELVDGDPTLSAAALRG